MSENNIKAAFRVPYKTLLLLALAVLTVIIWNTQRPEAPPSPLPEIPSKGTNSIGSSNELSSAGQLLVDERLGLTLADQGDFATAAEKFANLVRLRPDDAEAHSRLADALSALGKNEEAARHYEESVRLNYRDQSSLKGLALSLGRLGRAKEAEDKFRELIAKDPNESDAHYFLGLTLVMQGKKEEAVKPFTDAIRLDPENAIAMNDLAWIRATHPNKDIRNAREAIALAEKACGLTEYRDPQMMGTLDACYAEDGRFEDAIAMARRVSQLARHLGNYPIAEAAGKREELYLQRQAFRDIPPAQK